jgi:hypothetical protein
MAALTSKLRRQLESALADKALAKELSDAIDVNSVYTGAPAAGAAQAAVVNSTGGVANGTMAAVGVTNTGDVSAAINKNFTELFKLLDAIRTALIAKAVIKGSA